MTLQPTGSSRPHTSGSIKPITRRSYWSWNSKPIFRLRMDKRLLMETKSTRPLTLSMAHLLVLINSIVPWEVHSAPMEPKETLLLPRQLVTRNSKIRRRGSTMAHQSQKRLRQSTELREWNKVWPLVLRNKWKTSSTAVDHKEINKLWAPRKALRIQIAQDFSSKSKINHMVARRLGVLWHQRSWKLTMNTCTTSWALLTPIGILMFE